VFNFRVIQKIGKWEVTAEIDNLLDEQYETGGSVGASPSSFNTDKTVEENFYSPAPGRSFGLSARLKF
jgi:outer membrane receptor protein involved in Fe transport